MTDNPPALKLLSTSFWIHEQHMENQSLGKVHSLGCPNQHDQHGQFSMNGNIRKSVIGF